MNSVIILIIGYAKQISDGWIASSTVTLVKSGGKNIVVDPGCNRGLLIKKLQEQNLALSDIDFVHLTHNHTDHALLTGMFEKALVLNESEIYDGDKQVEHGGAIPGTDIKIIDAPGHDQFHSALIVPTQEGIYAVAGDVFWWMDNEPQNTDSKCLLAHSDPYVKNEKTLLVSRKELLKIADFIIPGHGKMFKVEK